MGYPLYAFFIGLRVINRLYPRLESGLCVAQLRRSGHR